MMLDTCTPLTEVQPGQAFHVTHPPTHSNTMGNNNTPTSLKRAVGSKFTTFWLQYYWRYFSIFLIIPMLFPVSNDPPEWINFIYLCVILFISV